MAARKAAAKRSKSAARKRTARSKKSTTTRRPTTARPAPKKRARKAAKPAARKKVAARKAAPKRVASRKVAPKKAVKRSRPGVAAAPPVAAPAPITRSRGPTAAVRAEAPAEVDHDFMIVKLTLDALNAETGSNAGGNAEADVMRFRADPGGANLELFGRVSSLGIRRWYASVPEKPNAVERGNLWITVRRKMDKNSDVANPGGWDGSSEVIELANIADMTP